MTEKNTKMLHLTVPESVYLTPDKEAATLGLSRGVYLRLMIMELLSGRSAGDTGIAERLREIGRANAGRS